MSVCLWKVNVFYLTNFTESLFLFHIPYFDRAFVCISFMSTFMTLRLFRTKVLIISMLIKLSWTLVCEEAMLLWPQPFTQKASFPTFWFHVVVRRWLVSSWLIIFVLFHENWFHLFRRLTWGSNGGSDRIYLSCLLSKLYCSSSFI